ncbi:MAG: NTP transferase domain-containing protein [Bacteroidales bacterium]|nr:NTP transferase domain-containing protein [Bacteroidales bacterium]
MKAMIFAAGIGSRLQPLTLEKPKALIEINKTPVLEIAIKNLIKFGFDEIIINVHHFPEQIINFLKEKNNFGIRIEISNEKNMLLNTGGGLKKASWFFNDCQNFLLYNVDILSEINLKDFYDYHIKNNSLASLAVQNRNTSRYLLFDDEMYLRGWENKKTNEKILISEKRENLKPFAFNGIHMINTGIFNLISEQGSFSIIDLYLRLASKNKIRAYDIGDTFWMDIGKINDLKKAKKIFNTTKTK